MAAPQAPTSELGVATPPLPTQVVPTHGRTELLRPASVTVTRYRYRGAQIPTPWTVTG
jgi:hypothetical protein